MFRWSFLDRFTDLGLLVLRAGVGAIFLFIHGLPRLVADSQVWSRVGRAVGYLGIDSGHAWWGLAAIVAMTAGAVCLIVGFLHRPAALALTVTMAVATIWKFYPFGGWDAAAHPATMGVVCLALVILGPGRYALDRG
jgi:putative oxidoreductase